MRTTPELIAELDEEATSHWHVAMVVGFESSTIFLQTTDDNRLETLNFAVRAGGIPVGLIAMDRSGPDEVAMRVRPYSEHEDRAEVEAYLLALANQVAKTLTSGEKP